MTGKTTVNDLKIEITEIKGEIKIIKESMHNFIDEFKRTMYGKNGVVEQMETTGDYMKAQITKEQMFKFAIGSGWLFVLGLGVLNILHMVGMI